MNIKLIAIGKTDDKSLQTLISDYSKRLNFYIKFELEVIPDIKNVKNLSEKQQKEKEGEMLLSKLHSTDYLILFTLYARWFMGEADQLDDEGPPEGEKKKGVSRDG